MSTILAMALSKEERAEVEHIVKATISKAFGIAQSADIEYLDTQKAVKFLGYDHPRSLYKLINSGVLRIGKEVQDRRSDGSNKANYYFNKQACLKRLNTRPEKRAK